MPVDPKTRKTAPTTKRMLGSGGGQDLADVMSNEQFTTHGGWNVLKGAFTADTVVADPDPQDVRDADSGASA
jgi:hypothetical protein